MVTGHGRCCPDQPAAQGQSWPAMPAGMPRLITIDLHRWLRRQLERHARADQDGDRRGRAQHVRWLWPCRPGRARAALSRGASVIQCSGGRSTIFLCFAPDHACGQASAGRASSNAQAQARGGAAVRSPGGAGAEPLPSAPDLTSPRSRQDASVRVMWEWACPGMAGPGWSGTGSLDKAGFLGDQ